MVIFLPYFLLLGVTNHELFWAQEESPSGSLLEGGPPQFCTSGWSFIHCARSGSPTPYPTLENSFLSTFVLQKAASLLEWGWAKPCLHTGAGDLGLDLLASHVLVLDPPPPNLSMVLTFFLRSCAG
jgi:hypothetical protein